MRRLDDLHRTQGEVTPIDSVQTPATWVKNGVKQSKPKILKVKRSKAHRKLRVKQVKGQPDTKSHQSTIPTIISNRFLNVIGS